jgi:hypothetical protein
MRRTSVLARIIRPEEDGLSADAARSLLRLAFDEKDRERMHNLATRHNAGQLTAEELAKYRQAVLVLDLLKSKARLSSKKLGLANE